MPESVATAGTRTAHPLLLGLARLFFPPACAACLHPLPEEPAPADGIVCGPCWARLEPLGYPQCARCGHPRLSAAVPGPADPEAATGAADVLPPCRWCNRLPAHVRAVRSVCRVDVGSGRAVLQALKYGGWSAVADPMAHRMGRLAFPVDVRRECVALIPLPLSRTRHRERGYNQAEVLARALGRQWALPTWTGVLERTRDTRSQVRLTPSQRAANVSHAFSVPPSATDRLVGAHLMLVDDVVTTASTLNAAAEALVAGGARIISYVTFGRAPDPGDRPPLDP